MKRTSQFHPQTIHFNYNTRDIVEHMLAFLKCVTKHKKFTGALNDQKIKLTLLLFTFYTLLKIDFTLNTDFFFYKN
jgi:hypothetical protein